MMNEERKIQGYIFDFNGTMFFDGAKHDQAWRRYLEERLGRVITREEFMKYAYGRPNHMILEHFFGRKLSDRERVEASREKEAYYRKLCLEDRDSLHLTRGLPGFLDRLKKAGCPLAIASAANKDNMEFYFSVFHLEQWFDWNRVVYDDGILKGKPEPDYFIEAARRLHLLPKACHVFEDSVSGVLAAHRADAGYITAVYGDSDLNMLMKQKLADAYIRDFESFTAEPVD